MDREKERETSTRNEGPVGRSGLAEREAERRSTKKRGEGEVGSEAEAERGGDAERRQ